MTDQPAPSVSYSEALALLEQARNLDAFVDEQGSSHANSWQVRRALQVSKRLYAAAQVSASLAIADELRQVRELLAEPDGVMDPAFYEAQAAARTRLVSGEFV